MPRLSTPSASLPQVLCVYTCVCVCVSSQGNDCGVTVDGVIAIVDEKAADRARTGLEIE